MILPLSARCSLQNLPAVGERVIYATSNGATMKGRGQVIALVPRKSGLHVKINLDVSHCESLAPGYIRIMKVTSLFKESAQ